MIFGPQTHIIESGRRLGELIQKGRDEELALIQKDKEIRYWCDYWNRLKKIERIEKAFKIF